MCETRVVAVVQARMGSTRLPGKVLKRVGERTVLEILLSRLDRTTTVDETVVATSETEVDDRVASEAREHDFEVVRGSETDVLDRFLTASRVYDADVVVRICADNPLTPAELVDELVD